MHNLGNLKSVLRRRMQICEGEIGGYSIFLVVRLSGKTRMANFWKLKKEKRDVV